MSAYEAIKEREAALSKWLLENAPYIDGAQKHLDEGTAERAYWHYGYMVGLRDAARLVDPSRTDT